MTFAEVIAPLPVWAFAATILLAINLLAYALFGIDKTRAQAGDRRISEATLLWAAFLGGFPGAKLGQRRFRHKTRKQPFARRLNMIGISQAIIVPALAIPSIRRMLFDAAAQAWAFTS